MVAADLMVVLAVDSDFRMVDFRPINSAASLPSPEPVANGAPAIGNVSVVAVSPFHLRLDAALNGFGM